MMPMPTRQIADVLLVGEALAQDCGPTLAALGHRLHVAFDLASAEALLQSLPISAVVAKTREPPADFQVFDLAARLRPQATAIAVSAIALPQAMARIADRHHPHHILLNRPLDGPDLGFTLAKVGGAEIFGMERYDIPVIEKIEFAEVEGRYPPVDRIKAYFQNRGIPDRIVEKVELALHELTMNAARSLDQGRTDGKVELAYGLAEEALAVSVTDPLGSLTSERLFQAIARATVEKSVVDLPGRGAGLGLLMTLQACGRLVFNVAPGRKTEAIAIFHRANSLGESARMGHAFHYFEESNR